MIVLLKKTYNNDKILIHGALVKRLRRGPLKAKTRVRFSYASPNLKHNEMFTFYYAFFKRR